MSTENAPETAETRPAVGGPVQRMVRPPRRADIDRLRRLLDEWRREDKNLASHYGDKPAPGSMRAKMVRDAEALKRALAYLMAQNG